MRQRTNKLTCFPRCMHRRTFMLYHRRTRTGTMDPCPNTIHRINTSSRTIIIGVQEPCCVSSSSSCSDITNVAFENLCAEGVSYGSIKLAYWKMYGRLIATYDRVELRDMYVHYNIALARPIIRDLPRCHPTVVMSWCQRTYWVGGRSLLCEAGTLTYHSFERHWSFLNFDFRARHASPISDIFTSTSVDKYSKYHNTNAMLRMTPLLLWIILFTILIYIYIFL